ncbi:hypothetical protein BOX15_Mlig009527g3, partial [Macrostomum lignano]
APLNLIESGALCQEGSDLVFEILQSVSDICSFYRPTQSSLTGGSQQSQAPLHQQRQALTDLVNSLEQKLKRLRVVYTRVAAASKQVAQPDPIRLLPLEGDIPDEQAPESIEAASAAKTGEAKQLIEQVNQLNAVIKRLASGNSQLIHQLSVMLSELPTS